MSILRELEQELKGILKTAGYEVERLALEESNRKDLGEYQLNDAMQLAKMYHENPREIASKIVLELEKTDKFENINIAGPGFINISLSEKYLCDIANRMKEDVFSNIDKKEPKKILIDYGGANVAKALHVGHLRSANIGEALKRLANLLGYEAIGDAHLGDYGRPLGLVIQEIKERYPNLAYFNENYEGDYEELEIPITNQDLEIFYPIASAKAKNDENYLEEGRKIAAKIQNHEKGYYDLWKKIVEISKADIKETYDKLNVHFEIWNGESNEMEYYPSLEDKCRSFLEESDGAKIIEIKEDDDIAPMPPLLFVKSNGTVSYETTDLATILEREENLHPDEMWYVVDARQSLHFDQVFRVARKTKLIEENQKLEHIGFGTMNGKDGKPFKTRDGGVMSLKELIHIVYEETYRKITNESIPEEEKEIIAEQVAIAAVKYADLLPFRGTDYIFEVEKFSDLEGKTGPYLLYSTIRMKSLLKKAEGMKQKEVHKLKGNVEREIILTLLSLPVVLDKAITVKSLNDIAEYIYRLTSLYNKFYADNRILTEEDESTRESWLALTQLIYQVNTMLLNTLGITIPNKM